MLAKDSSEMQLSWKIKIYNAAIHLAIIGFTIYITVLSFANGIYLFSYHAPLMLAGVSIQKIEFRSLGLTNNFLPVSHLYDRGNSVLFE